MPDGGRISFEHEIAEKLKKLDAQIKVPETPDAQAIFERAEKKKNNVFSLRTVRYAAAAAVILICVSIPAVSMLMTKNGVSTDNASFMYDDATQEVQGSQNGEETEKSAQSAFVGVSSARQEDAEDGAVNDALVPEEGINVGEALESYFSAEKKSGNSTTGGSESKNTAKSFADSLNKKRTVDVEVNDDSVSVMLYDVSGQSEILTALWVEGTFESAGMTGDYYIVTVKKAVTREEFESGYYMPMIGSPEGGASYLSEEEVFVSDEVAEAVFTISVSINIENGGYEIYATLT